MTAPASRLSARASYLLAVEKARNRLPPRTTSVWAHNASPAELAMGPSTASAHVRRVAPCLVAPASDVTRHRAGRAGQEHAQRARSHLI